jgi:RNA polymerase sigma-70 factor (ECF subfamily)
MDKQLLVEKVRAAQSGDRAAFGWLVESFQEAVLAIGMRRLGNYAEAQELSQEVFIHAMNKITQLQVPEAFGGWLRSIAGRMAINRAVRSKSAISTDSEILEATVVDRASPLDDALQAEQTTQVRAGLQRLRDLDRLTLEAFYLEGNSIDQMSVRFDAPVGTIKRRLHMARKRLAEELAEEMTAV